MKAFLQADEATRCEMYMTYRDLRRCFDQLELQEEMGLVPELACSRREEPVPEGRLLRFWHRAFSN